MGRTKGPYNAEFPVGTKVRVASLERLQSFAEEWQFHNPLSHEQLRFAESVSEVERVGYYHGGDELYELVGIPGVWHEACLERAV